MGSSLTRRHFLSAASALALASCNRNKGTGYFGYALVANAGDHTLAAVDLTAFRLAKTIPLKAAPSAVVAASGNLAYVLTPLSGAIHLVDANLELTESQRLADELSGIRVSAGRGNLVAVSETARELIQADVRTLRPIRRHKLNFPPTAMDLSETGFAAVADETTGQLALIDLANGQRTQVELPHPLGAITFRGDDKLLLVANLQGRSILALDVPSLQVVAELPLAMQPEHLCFNSDQGQLFVSGAGMDGVAVVFPYNTLEVDQTLLAGHAPGAMACSENPAYLFVASTVSSSVCVLNIDTRKQLGLVEVGAKPSFVLTTPDSQYALILNETSGDLAVIHIPGIRTTSDAKRLKNGTALFTMLNVGARPVHAAIISRQS
jgi:DNA-binding beta-propeller fold protein YncE